MDNQKVYKDVKNLLPNEGDSLILGYRGSISHGLYIPNSDPDSIDDIDLMNVFVAPKNYYLGLTNTKQTQESFVGVYDIVSYEIRHFVKLLLKGNPNVIGLLFLKPEHYIHISPLGGILISYRDSFLSKKMYHSFVGYAHGQWKRMTHFDRKGYMGEKRKQLITKHGYDTKNASHLIRLLRMGIELFQEGKVNVYRDFDADILLDIKKGKWRLDEVKEYAETLFDDIKDRKKSSDLPDEPDFSYIEKHVIYIIEKELEGK